MTGMPDINVEEVMRGIHNLSPAWRNAKYEYDGITEVPYTNLGGEVGRKAASELKWIRVIDNTVALLSKGAVGALSKDRFIVDYVLSCDMEKEDVIYRTISFSIPIEWQVNHIRVHWRSGTVQPVIIPVELTTMVKERRHPDPNQFAPLAGLNYRDVKKAETHHILKVLTIISVCAVGQNKLSRLVKGCLLFLDRLEFGPITALVPWVNSIPYTIEGLVASMEYDEVAFVWVTDHISDAYGAILYACCQEYPNPFLGGVDHVNIPAEAENIYVVGYNIVIRMGKVAFTAQMIWRALVMYCEQFGLGESLEAAFRIASTLRENRYFQRASLPCVVSYCDLVYPALMHTKAGVDMTWMNLESAMVIGRIHQMLSLVLFKDLDTCVSNTTAMASERDYFVRSLLSTDPQLFFEYMEGQTACEVLNLTSELKLWHNLANEEMAHIRSFSVFEAFWLITHPKVVLKNGVIKCLKKGYKPGMWDIPGFHVNSFTTVGIELALSDHTEVLDVPNGGYDISFSGLRSATKERRKAITFEKKSYSGGDCIPSQVLRKSYSGGWECATNSESEATSEEGSDEDDEDDESGEKDKETDSSNGSSPKRENYQELMEEIKKLEEKLAELNKRAEKAKKKPEDGKKDKREKKKNDEGKTSMNPSAKR